MPEQVQDFYPTPGTLATCMWYTGIDPRTMKPVFVPKTPHDKALQRALMQWRKPQNRKLVLEALHKTGREDLIGYGKHCLIRPDKYQGGNGGYHSYSKDDKTSAKGGRGQQSGKSAHKSGSGKGQQGGKAGYKGSGKSQNSRSSQNHTPVRKAGWAKPKTAAKKGVKKK